MQKKFGGFEVDKGLCRMALPAMRETEKYELYIDDQKV